MTDIKIPGRAIKNSTQKNAVVLDPFAGSGSTLITVQKNQEKKTRWRHAYSQRPTTTKSPPNRTKPQTRPSNTRPLGAIQRKQRTTKRIQSQKNKKHKKQFLTLPKNTPLENKKKPTQKKKHRHSI